MSQTIQNVRNLLNQLVVTETAIFAERNKTLNTIRKGDKVTIKQINSITKKRKTVIHGICLKRKIAGINSTITVKTDYAGHIVTHTIPVYSNLIQHIELSTGAQQLSGKQSSI